MPLDRIGSRVPALTPATIELDKLKPINLKDVVAEVIKVEKNKLESKSATYDSAITITWIAALYLYVGVSTAMGILGVPVGLVIVAPFCPILLTATGISSIFSELQENLKRQMNKVENSQIQRNLSDIKEIDHRKRGEISKIVAEYLTIEVELERREIIKENTELNEQERIRMKLFIRNSLKEQSALIDSLRTLIENDLADDSEAATAYEK